MSSIQSLGISGIRGYTPDNYQMIEFMKPLTLIWGKNGSGKTVNSYHYSDNHLMPKIYHHWIFATKQ